jgi:pyruvate dehydrogenase E1 component alpha subunit/2-oxoisovalerate dehydrogenase E1 component alpha subunit
MKRFPAFDPPEYANWRPEPDLVRRFADPWKTDRTRRTVIESMTRDVKFDLYAGMLRARLHDIMLKRWVKQGVISKAWLGTGEEATTIGPVHALDRSRDVVAPMIRNAGACCEMGMSVADMLRGYLGTFDSPSWGRDGHVGSFSHRVLQPISNIGNMPPVAAGIALTFKMKREGAIALTWIGDGSVKSGPTHEALNFAAVQRLPVVFIIQNNQVALGTPVKLAHLPERFADLHLAYGCAGESFDGNNVLDAYATTRVAADRCRAGNGPVILSAETFRMAGHATHDEQEARQVLPAELFGTWGRRDPIGLYEEHLIATGDATRDDLTKIEEMVSAEVDHAADEALASREKNLPPPESALRGVYAD